MKTKNKFEDFKPNWVLTIVLILGTITVFFPLYMAIIIAFKQPSEMTNDVAGPWPSHLSGAWITLSRPWR